MNLAAVNTEVNRMKHDVAGITTGRKVSLDMAVGAVKEYIDLVVHLNSELPKRPLKP